MAAAWDAPSTEGWVPFIICSPEQIIYMMLDTKS